MKPADVRPVTWRGRRVEASVPHPIAAQSLDLRAPVGTACGAASSRVSIAAEMVPTDFANLSVLIARGEALASSYIEGISAPIIESLLPGTSRIGLSLNDAVDAVRLVRDMSDTNLSVALLCKWHALVMKSTPLAREHHGRLRTEQGWIGGASPIDAALVTPPPETVPSLIDDLVEFANRTDVEPILQAAVVHAQFELIHPFADGNGRVGRLLIDWVLVRRLRLVSPPSISSIIMGDAGGYLSGLTLYRMGDLDSWVSWFSSVVQRASQRQLALVQSVDELRARWRVRLLARRDSCAWSVLALLPRHLVIDAHTVVSELGVSPRAALTALEALAAADILREYSRPNGKGRPARLFVAPELLALIDVG